MNRENGSRINDNVPGTILNKRNFSFDIVQHISVLCPFKVPLEEVVHLLFRLGLQNGKDERHIVSHENIVRISAGNVDDVFDVADELAVFWHCEDGVEDAAVDVAED